MSRHHYLKCETEYYQAVESGHKKFEVRLNDRGYKKHDLVHLKEVVNGIETGRTLGNLEIKYILYGPAYGLLEDYCIFSW